MSETEARAKQLNEGIIEKEGRYLSFALSNEECGLGITAVPQKPVYVKGFANMRGQVIPVENLRSRFGMVTADITEQTCIIVVEFIRDGHKFSTGIVVDCVHEVLDIAGEDIEEAPQLGSTISTNFILGAGNIRESVNLLPNINRILVSDDFN